MDDLEDPYSFICMQVGVGYMDNFPRLGSQVLGPFRDLYGVPQVV